MQTQIKRILVFLLLMVMPVCCFLIDGGLDLGHGVADYGDTIVHHTQTVIYNDTVTNNELDSIFKVEMLPNRINWSTCEFYDFETGTEITKSVYFKMNEDGSKSYYVITGRTEPYIIEKRVEK